jgi:hypothetical protein
LHVMMLQDSAASCGGQAHARVLASDTHFCLVPQR